PARLRTRPGATGSPPPSPIDRTGTTGPVPPRRGGGGHRSASGTPRREGEDLPASVWSHDRARARRRARRRCRPMKTTQPIGRIPVRDVRPSVECGNRPAKAVVGEAFEVSATVFREGHDAVAANVVLKDPEGRPGPFTPMRELAPGSDRWGAEVTADAVGLWTYRVEAWADPVATWRRTAGIKVPAGIDAGLVLEEGGDLYERAAA